MLDGTKGRMKINIITNWRDQKGLWRGGCLLRDNLLTWGHDVSEVQFDSRFPLRYQMSDLNIFLETLRSDLFPHARKNWWVPSPEWAELSDLNFIPSLDLVICMAYEAKSLLASYTNNLTFVGWESVDRYDHSIKRSLQALHIAGGSILKGTPEVLEAWERYQLDLRLIVVGDEQVVKPRKIKNVEYLLHRLEDTELKRLQNESKIHLCPSNTESWGHTAHEGLSVDALVITSWPLRGAYTVASRLYSKRCLASLRRVDPLELSKLVLSYPHLRLQIQDQEKSPRNAFLYERKRFRDCMKRLINEAFRVRMLA